MTERLDTMSSVKLGGFRSQLEASCVSSHTEELWYNETVCLWMPIYTDRDNVTLHSLILVYSKNYFSFSKIFISRLFKMVASQSALSLNRGLSSIFCWLKSENHV